jgi:hypothetical protein
MVANRSNYLTNYGNPQPEKKSNFTLVPTMKETEYYETIASQNNRKEHLDPPTVTTTPVTSNTSNSPNIQQEINDLQIKTSITDNILYYLKKKFYNYDNVMTVRILLIVASLYVLEKVCGKCLENLSMEYKICLLLLTIFILFNVS